MQRRLTLIPFEPTWLEHESLDIFAIYRRPVRDPQTWEHLRDEDGFLRWDIAAPISVRQHTRLMQKGFEYITLADAADVTAAADGAVTHRGAVPLGHASRGHEDVRAYIYQPNGVRGPWDVSAYLADEVDANAERKARVEANVVEFGPDGAERFERETDPGYRLPQRYRDAVATAETSPAPKRRGRPRGSKNKPAVAEEAVTA